MKLGFKVSVLAFLFVFAALGLKAENRAEFRRVIKKEFSIRKDGKTGIMNKHGKVHINTWDKDRVKISVTIVVKAGNESVANEVFDRISINFDYDDDHVNAYTEIKPAKKTWWNWSGGNTDYSINYEVYMPETNELELEAKYCDVYVGNVLGEASISVKHGDLRVDELGDDLSLYVAYGNGTIAKVDDVSAEISYSNFTLKEASDVDLLSKYANITIEQAEDLQCQSKYDNYHIGRVKEFRNEGKHDNFELDFTESARVLSK